jgi:hypothetical protein
MQRHVDGPYAGDGGFCIVGLAQVNFKIPRVWWTVKRTKVIRQPPELGDVVLGKARAVPWRERRKMNNDTALLIPLFRPPPTCTVVPTLVTKVVAGPRKTIYEDLTEERNVQS